MALTLAEAAKLSNDVLVAGVIETVIQESPILRMLPFIEIVGNGLTYNQESTPPTAEFYDVGDTWQESTPTFTQKTATLRILGGDADIDNFLAATRSNVQDLEAAVVQLKARALQRKFEETFIDGDSTADPKAFDGLEALIPPEQTTVVAANGGSITFAKLDELIDLVKGGRPDLLLMSRRSRRALNSVVRNAGSLLETDRDEVGRTVTYYDGIPIGVSDFVSDARVMGTSTDCSTIYALQFGEGGLAGLTSPGGLQIERVGNLETRDAPRIRVKWYVSLALFNTAKAAKLIGVRG